MLLFRFLFPVRKQQQRKYDVMNEYFIAEVLLFAKESFLLTLEVSYIYT